MRRLLRAMRVRASGAFLGVRRESGGSSTRPRYLRVVRSEPPRCEASSAPAWWVLWARRRRRCAPGGRVVKNANVPVLAAVFAFVASPEAQAQQRPESIAGRVAQPNCRRPGFAPSDRMRRSTLRTSCTAIAVIGSVRLREQSLRAHLARLIRGRRRLRSRDYALMTRPTMGRQREGSPCAGSIAREVVSSFAPTAGDSR